jgi:hypothetical protein
MLIAGENDTDLRRTNIFGLFAGNRPAGALWAWVEEENTGHEEADAQQLKLSFLTECYRLRYPRDQSPTNGPVRLKPLNEWEGWLVDQATWTNGFTAIYRHDEYGGDPRALGWVPTERIAHLYRSFSSYDKISTNITGNANPVTAPTNLIYRVNLAGAIWEKVEFFEGAEKIGEAFPGGGNTPQVSLVVSNGGLYTFHSIVIRPDQTRSPTMPRRVVVSGPSEPTPYEAWAMTNLPDGCGGRSETPMGDGCPNIVRWGFGLGFPVSDRAGLPQALPGTTNIGGIPYRTFRFAADPAARNADAAFTPFFSVDLDDWTRVEHDPGAGGFRVGREDATVSVHVPAQTNRLFLRVGVDDPLPR